MKFKKGQTLPFGIKVEDGGVNFSYPYAGGETCTLLLYNHGEANPFKKYEMYRDTLSGTVCFGYLEGVPADSLEYNFEVAGKVIVDPYARAIAGKEEWGNEKNSQKHEVRARIIADDFDWEGDKPLNLAYHEIIAYSLHVRGFTMQASSKVRHKGTFNGLIEKLPYLIDLGINQIQCMPVYEFEECGTYKNYWGYGPAFYFAPKASYAASADAVQECKQLVKACHQAGIEVVLDMPFAEGTPQPLMEECLRYYRTEYHIDGFILNPYIARMEVIKSDPLLAGVKVMRKREEFQNIMRRFLKGDEGMVKEVMFWLKNHSEKDGAFNYITNHTGFTLYDLVSYDGKHNEANGEYNQDGPAYNYSWNCGAEGPTKKRNVIALRRKQMCNAFFLLLSAQGTPCILAGDEFANSQKGNNNAYCQDNEIGWIDWGKLKKETELRKYVKELIAFRKTHPVIHPEKELLGMDKTSSGIPDISYHGENAWQVPEEISSRQLGIYYSGSQVQEEACFVAYNMHWVEHHFALPALKKERKWYQVMSSEEGVYTTAELLKDQKTVELPERSTAIFIGR